MSRRLFWHVGAPKTGTTYLQELFARNRDVLADHGLTYPDSQRGTHFEAAIDLMDNPWGGQLADARGSWDALVRGARQAPGDVLLSHEVFAGARREHVERGCADLRSALGDDLELHVVYTARDLGRQIPAEWQQSIKHRGRRGFRHYVRDLKAASRTDSAMWFWRVQSLPDVLTRWGAGLPPERIHVVTVPRPGSHPDELWHRFASVVGLDPDLDLDPPDRANESMGIAEATLVRKLNAALRDKSVDHVTYAAVVRDLLVHETLAGLGASPRASVPPRSREYVDEVAAEWREWLTGSGVDVVGDVEELMPVWPDDGDDWSDPDRPDPEAVIDVAVVALAQLISAESQRRASAPVTRAKGLVRQVLGR